MRNRIQSFMAGRYGSDELSKVCLAAVIVLLGISLFLRWGIFYWLGLFLLIYTYFRIFSKNHAKRFQENRKYMNLRDKAAVKWNLTKKHLGERKTHRFFKCPQCRQKVRVPKGRGRICITCPKCNNEFIKKS